MAKDIGFAAYEDIAIGISNPRAHYNLSKEKLEQIAKWLSDGDVALKRERELEEIQQLYEMVLTKQDDFTLNYIALVVFRWAYENPALIGLGTADDLRELLDE